MTVQRNHPTGSAIVTPRRRVALVLAGCGAKDGSEITEATSLLVALSQEGFEVQAYAPDRPQHHVIDHLRMAEVAGTQRNILEEAARIARGKVLPLPSLTADRADAIVFAGGFGAAKNLCTFAFAGADATLMGDVRDALVPFLKARKPAAALCIAPVVLALGAREIGARGARLTLGDGGAPSVAAITAWGATHVPCAVDDCVIDEDLRFVSAPAYMYDDATPADIFASAKALVRGLRTLLG